MSDGQDWTKVQIGSGRGGRGGAHGGAGAAGRPHVSASVIAAAKLDAAEDVVKPKYFCRASVEEIQKYRRENSLTQRLLDGRCGFAAGTMNLLEGQKKTPSSKELQMLNNLLRTRLVIE